MKRISKTLSSVLLAAAIAVSSVQASEMTSVTANAAYTNDLSITGYAALDLTPDEQTEVDFTFSGEGIAAVRRESSSNLSVYTKEIIWSAYPNDCYAVYCVKSNDGNGGLLKFSLLDDDYQEAFSFTTVLYTRTMDLLTLKCRTNRLRSIFMIYLSRPQQTRVSIATSAAR